MNGVWKKGKWKKGKRTVTGKYHYRWAAGCFYIRLAGTDRSGGRCRRVTTYDDRAGFNGWKLVESPATVAAKRPNEKE